MKIPSKPIPEGFKRWTLAEAGYFICWIWHSKGVGPHCPRSDDLNPTQGVVAHLIDQLHGPKANRYHVWIDNLFNSTALCTRLYDRGIGCSGTARTNSGVHLDLINLKKQFNHLNLSWGELISRVDATGHVCSIGWVDHGLVLFLTNAEDPTALIEVLRKKPSKTSSHANISRKPFGPNEYQKLLPIPQIVDRYNHNMGGVDQGDQLRAQGTTPRASKGWKALLYDSFQLALCNTYLLAARAPGASNRPPITYLDVRRDVSSALIREGGDWGQGNQHPRLDQPNSANLDLPRYYLRDIDLHQRIKKSQAVCAICRNLKKSIKRGLDQGRTPLGDKSPNLLSTVPRPTSGCKTCKVNLCKYSDCWEIWHASLRDR